MKENGRMIKHIDSDKDNWKKVRSAVDDENLSFEIGSYFSNEINRDIKHVLFTLSRYKFVSNLLIYKENVHLLELGCSEGWGALLFKQNLDLKKYTGIDLDSDSIRWNQKNLPVELEFIEGNFFDEDICKKLSNTSFNAIVSMDVIEHISPDREDEFCRTIMQYLDYDGIAVIGTPSVMMAPYASEASRIGHINLYHQKRLYQLLSKYFHNVFIFNMNDEVVNTGFAPMSCYIIAVCSYKKNNR